MAAAMTMDREPEVARFIDSYKYDQDMATRRDRYGGGTSLPLNSDGYEEKQQRLRDERHKDWLVQQDKPAVLRNALFEEQRQMEQQKYEARRRSPPRPAQPPGPQMDYNLAGEQARAEERRAYQDYMKAKEERYWAMRGRPVTPPGGLDIGKYDRQLKETAQQKKKEYKEMLDQQQREHMYLRARQEPEMAIIDRNAAQPSQYLANKPPPGPSYGKGRDEAEERRRHDEMRQQQQISKPAELVKNPYYSSDDYEKFQREIQRKQGEEYRDFLAKSFQPLPGSVGLPLGQYKYEPKRLIMEAERNSEWNKLSKERTFRQKAPTPPELQGLPIGQQNYEPMHKAMEYQRNREYNEFLRKKYGGKGTLRSTRSEPPRGDQNEPKSSFYYGNEMEHEEKRKVLDAERRNEYNQFIKELDPPRSRSIEIPSDADSGLPIGQQHHEAWRKFLRNQRNKEYNQLVDMKSTEVHNRGWNFEQNGVLELRGDDEVQTRQRELRAERQKDYNSYISQMKTPSKRTWPDPEGRGALLVKQGEYDNVRQMYDEERKRDYIDRMQKRREMGLDLTPPSAPPEPLKGRYEYNNPMVDVLGRYDDYRKKLVDDRKRDFRTFMDQVKADEGSRRHLVSTAPNLAREETPLVYSMGTYELETKKQMRLERKKDLEDFVHEQQKHWTPRTTVKENLMPHVASAETPLVNYLGHYDKEKLKYRLERNKDLREFSQQKKQQQRNPYDNYVFPTVAVAEKPIVDYMGTGLAQRKRQLRDERKRDYEEYKMQQKYTNPSRRHDFVDTASGPYGGLFHGLGEHGNKSDVLNKERQQEYNDRLDHQFGKDRPSGRPNWVKETLPNNTDRGRSPMKSQPPADQYQQMLDEKRREEASRRRFEDPEYQDRLAQGRDRGEAGGRYGY